jgi:hypothetical protein
LGLPDKKQAVLDISSDDESSDDDDSVPRTKAKVSSMTKDIAHQWLSSIRKGAVSGKDVSEDDRPDISSDEGTESADDDRPVIAMSGQSRQIAKKWLDSIRKNNLPASSKPRKSDEISDEDSSDDGQEISSIHVGPKAKAIAKSWLQKGRQNLGSSTQGGVDVSDDDDSSDSEANAADGSSGVALTGKTKAIALAWLRNIRLH